MSSGVCLKTLGLHCKVPAKMSENFNHFLWGIFWVATGALILHYADAISRCDQESGIRSKVWLSKKLGKSTVNRELWSVGTPKAFRSSRIVFRIVGTIALLMGFALVGLSFQFH